MAVVDVNKEVKWDKETGFMVLFQLGIPEAELKKYMPAEDYAEYTKWVAKQEKETPK